MHGISTVEQSTNLIFAPRVNETLCTTPPSFLQMLDTHHRTAQRKEHYSGNFEHTSWRLLTYLRVGCSSEMQPASASSSPKPVSIPARHRSVRHDLRADDALLISALHSQSPACTDVFIVMHCVCCSRLSVHSTVSGIVADACHRIGRRLANVAVIAFLEGSSSKRVIIRTTHIYTCNCGEFCLNDGYTVEVCAVWLHLVK